MTDKLGWIDRRRLVQLLGAGGGAIAAGLPSRVFAQARKNTLVLGIDISDTITLDPARLAQYTSPMTVSAAYDSLVTMKPGEYINVAPSLATKWARTPDGKGWRFTLRDGVKFSTGNVDDGRGREVVVRPRHQSRRPALAIHRRTSTASRSSTSRPSTSSSSSRPSRCSPIIAAPEFVVLERKVAEANGGTRRQGRQDQGQGDHVAQRQFLRHRRLPASPPGSATSRSSSCATTITGRGKPPFERIVIRHISDGAAQLLAVRRGDIDAAFNLIPEQIAALKSEPNVRLAPLASLDFVYMALTQEPEFNKALAVKEARQAIGYAIDYDGIVKLDARRRGAAPGALSCRSASAARPRRSRARSASGRTSPRRRNCWPRPASRTASSSRSSTATPPCRASPIRTSA